MTYQNRPNHALRPEGFAAKRRRSPVLRLTLLVTGVLLLLVTPVVGVLPGPGGIFVFAAGLVLVLQNSRWARKQFVRAKKRYPRFGRYADMALRRRSARLRREREKSAEIPRKVPAMRVFAQESR